MDKPKPLFEHMTCRRCGGPGSFSYNQVHGTVCYGCGGSGYGLTRRGTAAQAYLDSLRKVRADSLKVGDFVYADSVFAKAAFKRITNIIVGRAKDQGCYCNDGEYTQIKIECDGYTTYHHPEDLVRKGFTKEEKIQHREAALAYQATLTKTGQPRK